MANAPQGRFRFAGIDADGEFTVTRSGSTKPDILTAQFILGANLPQYGDIDVIYGNNFIRIPNCRLIRQQIQGGTGGRFRLAQFEDFRWTWNYVYGFGNTNVKKKCFNSWAVIYKASKKSIIANFFNLLGYPNLITVPPDAFFEMNNAQYGDLIADDSYFESNHFDGRPLTECIEEVLQPLGLQVHVGWDNQARIFGVGFGREIPNDQRVMDYTISTAPPLVPEVLCYEFANVNFQNDFVLEAVGYLWDDKLGVPSKRLAPLSKLNYGPIDPATNQIDWTLADVPNFTNIKDKKKRELCRRTIFKLYRINSAKKIELVKPVFVNTPPKSNITFDDKDFILDDALWPASGGGVQPDEWKQFGVARDYNRLLFDDGRESDISIYGFFCDRTLHQQNRGVDYAIAVGITLSAQYEMTGTEFARYSDAGLRKDPMFDPSYERAFNFDPENMLVQFEDPVYFIDRNQAGAVQKRTYHPAKLVIRAYHRLRRRSDMEIIRYVQPVTINSPYVARGITDKIRIDDPVWINWFNPPRFDELKNKLSVLTNQYMATKRMVESATIPMKGFAFDINTDGRIASVTFQRDSNGACTTSVQWQNENPAEQPTYHELVASVLRPKLLEAQLRAKPANVAKLNRAQPKRGN